MQLSRQQWAVIRQIAAEQARLIINTETPKNPPLFPEAFHLGSINGLHPSQVEEICRIASSTTIKSLAKKKANSPAAIYEEFRRKDQQIAELEAQIKALTTDAERLRSQLTYARHDLDSVNAQLAASRAEVASIRLSQQATRPQDGDKWKMPDGETFTYFRGAWRRRSELEGFASAAQYL